MMTPHRRLCIPPTGKRFRTGGISIYRLSEEEIAEQWEQADLLGLLQQLDVLPLPGHGTRKPGQGVLVVGFPA